MSSTTTPTTQCDIWNGGNWWCDLPEGHAGQHVAYVSGQSNPDPSSRLVGARWPNTPRIVSDDDATTYLPR